MKNLFLILLFPFYLFSQNIEAGYNISYGIFGTLGNAYTKIQRDEKSYSITAKAETKGIARFLSNNRQEIYTSRGKILNGLLYPTEYKKIKSTNSYIKQKRYIFDHINKIVILERTDFYKDTKKTQSAKVKFPYYASNDILSLYFNLNDLTKSNGEKQMVFSAIGAKEEDGRIDIEKPQGSTLEDIKKFMNIDINRFLKVSINQNIFSSRNGEMIINIDENNICHKAVLKDVLLFGDIVATKIDNTKEIFE